MQSFVQGIATVGARVMIATIFFMSAVGNKIPNFSKVAEVMGGQGVPAPRLLLVGAIAFLVLGSLSIIVGFKARLGAALLLVFLVLATYFFHDFWTWPQDAMWVLSSNPDVKMPVAQVEMIGFMKNLSLMGTMLFLIANGAGPMSVDAMLARKRVLGSTPSSSETDRVS
ncbi:DoxX [Planctomycetes bacterium Pan216]|uniref:DoxX n=1 Tax=Kolteria novifilia TaxID=2527975 RepID=A0A518AY83_9BACT|nr:DoxX [Planctomycetes bacterium Pan216]